jgi:hypothetical protein
MEFFMMSFRIPAIVGAVSRTPTAMRGHEKDAQALQLNAGNLPKFG